MYPQLYNLSIKDYCAAILAILLVQVERMGNYEKHKEDGFVLYYLQFSVETCFMQHQKL